MTTTSGPFLISRKRRAQPLALLVLVTVGICWSSITVCTCGHLDMVTFLGITPLFLVAWTLFLLGEKREFLFVAVSMIALVLLSLIELKSIVDILWLGHEPLLRP